MLLRLIGQNIFLQNILDLDILCSTNAKGTFEKLQYGSNLCRNIFKGLRAESAKGCYWQTVPSQWEGEDFLTRQPSFFLRKQL